MPKRTFKIRDSPVQYMYNKPSSNKKSSFLHQLSTGSITTLKTAIGSHHDINNSLGIFDYPPSPTTHTCTQDTSSNSTREISKKASFNESIYLKASYSKRTPEEQVYNCV